MVIFRAFFLAHNERRPPEASISAMRHSALALLLSPFRDGVPFQVTGAGVPKMVYGWKLQVDWGGFGCFGVGSGV